MSYHLALRFWILIFTASRSTLAKGGRGGGGGGKVGGALSDATSGLSLPPLIAAIFAFFVISAVFTFFQALRALGNVYRRASQRPPSITLPEYSVGPIFPTLLLLSTLILLTYDILEAIAVGLLNNENTSFADLPTFTQSYYTAISATRYLTEILLMAGALALLAHRERVLTTTSPGIRGMKIALDAVLTATFFSLGMAIVGLSSTAVTTASVETVDNIYLAYLGISLVIGVDISVTSIVLYFRARRSPVNDHGIISSIAYIVSPAFILYTVSLIIIWKIPPDTFFESDQENLAIIVIRTVLLFIIIATCLGFGMPPIPKQKK